MRVKADYIMKEIAGNYVVVPTGNATIDFSGIITLNETGAFLWNGLYEAKNEDELASLLLEEYDVDENTARSDIREFVARLEEADLFE